jgi:hypothetical protein
MCSPEKVARTSIYLASAPEAVGITGKYFDSITHPKDLPGEVIDYIKQERTCELGTSLVRRAPTAIANQTHLLYRLFKENRSWIILKII